MNSLHTALSAPLLLAGVGAAEAVVYYFRYRCGDAHSPAWVGLWTWLTCVLRVAFVGLGVSAFIAGSPWWVAVLAYATPAAVVTAWVHHRVKRDNLGRTAHTPAHTPDPPNKCAKR